MADAMRSGEWIDRLADGIREKNRDAAQAYGRDQHFAEVVERLGKEFFVRFATELERDVDALRRRLQGDATSAETVVQPGKAGELLVRRERFPWVDAVITHREDSVLVDYAKGVGLPGDPMVDRQSRAFLLRANAEDRVYAEDAFGDRPGRYESPEELARCVMELLFGV